MVETTKLYLGKGLYFRDVDIDNIFQYWLSPIRLFYRDDYSKCHYMFVQIGSDSLCDWTRYLIIYKQIARASIHFIH